MTIELVDPYVGIGSWKNGLRNKITLNLRCESRRQLAKRTARIGRQLQRWEDTKKKV